MSHIIFAYAMFGLIFPLRCIGPKRLADTQRIMAGCKGWHIAIGMVIGVLFWPALVVHFRTWEKR